MNDRADNSSLTPPRNFCILPWVNASVDVNGSFRPCCKFAQPNEPGAPVLGNLRSQSLEEIWNGEPMQNLRQEFLENQRPAACRSCWSEEDSGVISYRQEFARHRLANPEALRFTSVIAKPPVALDLKLSQKCNLKCRICSPIASSTFLEEERANNPHFYLSDDEISYLSAYKLIGNEKQVEWFKKLVPNLQHIEIFGGEPMLGKENREIENMLVEASVEKQISLLYNTNATVISQPVVESWKKFKRVQVCLSVDDIGERLEFQRFPAKWPRIEANIRQYLESKNDRIDLTLFCSVSVLNVFYLQDYVRWQQSTFPQIPLYFNIVHDPNFFCVSNLPAEMRNEASEGLKTVLAEVSDERTRWQIEDVLKFLARPGSLDPDKARSALFHELAYRDRIRKQSWDQVLPRLRLAYAHSFEGQSGGR